ncbi:DMT family transporter [Plastoroseomonas arctica]|uniref:DMT family transporter n=1 Tax=Plastoroseomonas arctica TaxID=1509237 RepID=A0AAF1JUR5_9PROT|nr:DMT family transporter [Plastoroseomonas arctica]MBR0653492.1 DMT family transporter [Plastoroseomonas arctica]
MAEAPRPMRHDIRRGALLMLGATALFTVMGAFAKEASVHLPFVELMFFRSALALPVVVALVFRGNAWRALRTKRFPGHVLRACSGTAAMACGFYALSVLPLAEQVALTYTSPLFVTMLAIPFLGEKVGIHRWSAVLVGFGGIVIMALGQGAFAAGAAAGLLFGTIAAVSNGAFSAVTTLLVRGLSATETSTTIVLWQSVLMTTIIGMALPFVWVTPTWSEWLLLLAMGLFGGIAQVMMTEANASAQVSALGPYSYGAILWSMLLGWTVWGDVPGVSTLAGAALIVAAGLYILHREWQRRIR